MVLKTFSTGCGVWTFLYSIIISKRFTQYYSTGFEIVAFYCQHLSRQATEPFDEESFEKKPRKDLKFYNFIEPDVNAYVASKGVPRKVLSSTIQYKPQVSISEFLLRKTFQCKRKLTKLIGTICKKYLFDRKKKKLAH